MTIVLCIKKETTQPFQNMNGARILIILVAVVTWAQVSVGNESVEGDECYCHPDLRKLTGRKTFCGKELARAGGPACTADSAFTCLKAKPGGGAEFSHHLLGTVEEPDIGCIGKSDTPYCGLHCHFWNIPASCAVKCVEFKDLADRTIKKAYASIGGFTGGDLTHGRSMKGKKPRKPRRPRTTKKPKRPRSS